MPCGWASPRPFISTKLFAPHFAPGAAIVNISSSRDRMSQPQTESYTAAKGGISALTHALAVSLGGQGAGQLPSLPAGSTPMTRSTTGPDADQQPAGRVGNPLDIANMVLLPLLGQGGLHHRRKHLHRRRHDPPDDLPQRLRLDICGRGQRMKTAICYLSCHHGNTRKVVEAMAEASGADLIDVHTRQAVRLEEYDRVGFASGIYGFGECHKELILLLPGSICPQAKPVFFVYTYGGDKGQQHEDAACQIAREKGCPVLGEFSCKGHRHLRPFQAGGRPCQGSARTQQDLERARTFYRGLRTT